MLDILTPEIIGASLDLAAKNNVQESQAFFDTALGGTIKTLLFWFGILLMIGAAISAGLKVMGGKTPAAVKIVFGAVVVGALCFQPELLVTLTNFAGGLIGDGASTLEDSTGGGNL